MSISAPLPKPLLTIRSVLTAIEWPDLLWSIAITLLGFLAGRLLAALLARMVRRWVAHAKTLVDEAMLEPLRKPTNWLLPVVGASVALPATSLPVRVEIFLQQLLLICSIVGLGGLFLAAVRVVEAFIQRRFDLNAHDSLRSRDVQTQFRGFRNIMSFLIVVVTIALVLLTFERVRQVGAGLLASAGIAGIVIGFAAQRTLGTLLAGVQIALNHSILVGDQVVVEKEFGTVEEITLTYVVIRLWDQRRMIVPVSYFIEKPFENWSRVSPEVLGTVYLRLDYTVPVEALRGELLRILEASSRWDKRAWALQVTDADQSSVTVRALLSARSPSDAFELRCEVRERLIAFVQHNYPTALPQIRAQAIES